MELLYVSSMHTGYYSTIQIYSTYIWIKTGQHRQVQYKQQLTLFINLTPGYSYTFIDVKDVELIAPSPPIGKAGIVGKGCSRMSQAGGNAVASKQ